MIQVNVKLPEEEWELLQAALKATGKSQTYIMTRNLRRNLAEIVTDSLTEQKKHVGDFWRRAQQRSEKSLDKEE